ncbi:MAG TPA: hypothetical protein VK249_32925 [Anaerolineales bacterium]|nr:hypothetical protein [Anaerolineales bacterium]
MYVGAIHNKACTRPPAKYAGTTLAPDLPGKSGKCGAHLSRVDVSGVQVGWDSARFLEIVPGRVIPDGRGSD